MLKSILEKINQFQDETNLSDRELSLRAGQSQDLIRNWRRRLRSGEVEAGANAHSVNAVAAVMGVSARVLMGLDDDAASDGVPRGINLSFAQLQRVPVFDIQVAAGNTTAVTVTSENPLYDMGFSDQMLNRITQARTDQLAVLEVRGDSMAPTLMDGDMILVDSTRRNINQEGMFVLRYEDVLRVKRIDKNPKTGKFMVKSDNPIYDPFEVEAHDIDVVGRVAWMGRRT